MVAKLTAVINSSLRTFGHEALSTAKTLGTKWSGMAFKECLVRLQTDPAGSCARSFTCDANTRAHKVVSDGMVGKARIDNADEEGLLCCADNESASEGAPKATDGPVRCLLEGRDDDMR